MKVKKGIKKVNYALIYGQTTDLYLLFDSDVIILKFCSDQSVVPGYSVEQRG